MLATPAPFLIAIGISAIIALLAWHARSLSWSGAVAATVVGTVATRTSYGLGLYVIVWFALATVLSKIGKAKKSRRLQEIVEKGSQRDAWQVLANGGVFAGALGLAMQSAATCSLAGVCDTHLVVAALGALAAAGSDTWATEIGTLAGGTPWSLRSASRVPAGTSGAVTVSGSLAMIGGAVILALLAFAVGSVTDLRQVGAIAIGGVAGALADTLLGAWIQERRWCPRCTMETEQRTHRCGTLTVHHRGLTGLNNDLVNFACTIVGALVALLLVLS
ncbi:MAG: DUF92 domain-containing protein [Gemmatimonas sp.]